jgi:hypothetical protein
LYKKYVIEEDKMEMNYLDKEWLKIVKEVKESDITEEEFKAFIESKKREKEGNR